MSLILDLRGRTKHAGVPLTHPTSEHVVLANVFGILKNFSPEAVLIPWLEGTTGHQFQPSTNWQLSFWEKQERPIGIIEGSTEVDLMINSENALVFVEVKMDAQPSAGTKADSERNQLVRNLDIGYARATREKKAFALIYVTPDPSMPEIVLRIRQVAASFPTNPRVLCEKIASCLFWISWGSIGDAIASTYVGKILERCEQSFARDLLAYLANKGLWKNTLPDEPLFYEDKLYRSLRKANSPFVPYSAQTKERDQAWRSKEWAEPTLRSFLSGLREEDRALLKILAEAGGALQQHSIMEKIPFLRGKSSASLRALKAHINAGCKSLDRAPILSEGTGSGKWRVHEINRSLGELRDVVVEVARGYEIRWDLLGREALTESGRRSDSEGTVVPPFERQPRSATWRDNALLKSDFDRHELKEFLDAFKGVVRREQDKGLADRLEDELLRREPPGIERRTLERLAKWCNTENPLYRDGMEIARSISQLLFGEVLDRKRLGV